MISLDNEVRLTEETRVEDSVQWVAKGLGMFKIVAAVMTASEQEGIGFAAALARTYGDHAP